MSVKDISRDVELFAAGTLEAMIPCSGLMGLLLGRKIEGSVCNTLVMQPAHQG